MITNEAIAAQAAALAHQFWLEIEAEFIRQTTRCEAGQPAQARLPSDPRPRDDETSPGWAARPVEPGDHEASALALRYNRRRSHHAPRLEAAAFYAPSPPPASTTTAYHPCGVGPFVVDQESEIL
jgi:hypothetical protein